MSYRLNKTDGTLLTELIDGRIDNSTTDLTFIGKNYQGFGEFLNENFIKLLESFANTSAPSKPIKGQTWFDTTNNRLKVYDGTTFRSTDNSVISGTAPLEKIEGDIWIDSSKNQMYFWDGDEWILIGPDYTKTQGLSGFVVETVKDTFGLNRVIVKLFIAATPIIIFARETFTPATEITGFGSLRMGMNINSAYSTFAVDAIADKALAITNELGEDFLIDDFVSATDPLGDTMAGKLDIANDNGIRIGADLDQKIWVDGTVVKHQNIITNSDYQLLLKDSSDTYIAQHWDAADKRLGILTETPGYTLDVTGDGRFTGDLRIEGDLTIGTLVNEDVTSLRVADKNIQLAIPDDSTLLDSASDFVDDAGLLIETTAGSIKWTYRVATQSWTTEDNIDIDDDNGAYKISGNDVITRTSLASTITSAPGLTTIGTLGELTVDNININNNSITNSSAGIELNSAGPVNLTTIQKITNVSTPVSARAVAENPLLTEDPDSTVATKGYIDTEIGARPYVFALDVTGFSITISTSASDNGDVKDVLDSIANPVNVPNGTNAYIHASSIAASGTDTADVNSQLNKSFIAVDSGGTQNVSVLQDLNIAAVNITPTFTVTRYTMNFKVIAGSWTHVQTTAYTP